MYAWGDKELPDDEIMRILKLIAQKIHSTGMSTIAIITLETVKPLSNLGAELSRMLLSPILPVLGPEYNLFGDKMIYILQRRENIEKLITMIEEKLKNDKTTIEKDVESVNNQKV